MKRACFPIALLSLLLLTGCFSDLDNPVADGKQYALEAQANIATDKADQDRDIEREDQNWENEKRTEKMDLWTSIEPVAKFASRVGIFFIVLVSALAACFSIGKTAQAYGEFITIRARIVPPDRQTGLVPQLLWPAFQESSKSGFLEKFSSAVHVRNTRWMLIDSSTGEHAMMDEEKPSSNIQIEIKRQLVLAWQVARQQKASAIMSPSGDVAEAIGHGSIEIPDAGNKIIDFEKAKGLLVDQMFQGIEGENNE